MKFWTAARRMFRSFYGDSSDYLLEALVKMREEDAGANNSFRWSDEGELKSLAFCTIDPQVAARVEAFLLNQGYIPEDK